MTVSSIVDLIQNEPLFDFVQCDISVPDQLKHHFSEMCPKFKNTEMKFEDISSFMQEFVETNYLSRAPRRSLIGSFHGKGILQATPLLKWYLDHGLHVSDIQLVIEYEPDACFSNFGEQVSNARREGNINPDHEIISNASKLLENASFGRTIIDKSVSRRKILWS